MGGSAGKEGSQPPRARTLTELINQIINVNSILSSICKCKPQEAFFVQPPSTEENFKRLNTLLLYRYNMSTIGNISDLDTYFPNHPEIPPYKVITISHFSALYHRVQLFAPIGNQSSSTPTIVENGNTSTSLPHDSSADADSECMICMENPVEVVLPDCNHAFCNKCLTEWTAKHSTCPMCRSKTDSPESLWIIADDPSPEELYQSICELLSKL